MQKLQDVCRSFLGGPMGPLHPVWGHVLVNQPFARVLVTQDLLLFWQCNGCHPMSHLKPTKTMSYECNQRIKNVERELGLRCKWCDPCGVFALPKRKEKHPPKLLPKESYQEVLSGELLPNNSNQNKLYRKNIPQNSYENILPIVKYTTAL